MQVKTSGQKSSVSPFVPSESKDKGGVPNAPALLPQPTIGVAGGAQPVTMPQPFALAMPDAGGPAMNTPDASTPFGRGPYPECRYLGCSGPLAWRGCVYCEEIQHYDYYPALHGNYYFAPYNAIKVPFQQAFVTRYGGDPRAPYADGVFQKVYAAYRVAHPAPAKGSPTTTGPEEVQRPEPANAPKEDETDPTPERG